MAMTQLQNRYPELNDSYKHEISPVHRQGLSVELNRERDFH